MKTEQINEAMPLAAMSIADARTFFSGLIAQELSPRNDSYEDSQSDLMNINDAADFLGKRGYFLKRSSIYNLINAKAIPYRKIGRRVVFSRCELTEWVDHKVAGDTPQDNPAVLLAKSANRKK